MIWATGQLLQSGKYRVIEKIGGGGFGLTYLAEDQMLHRQVVVKAPNHTFQQDQDYEKFVRRFQREGQVLAKINHPNVVRVIELFQEAGMPCLVMEYMEGETLNQLIRRTGYLTEEDAIRCFRELASALQMVHQMGLIHCDVHPGNIILRQGAEPILIDFGSSKSVLPMTYTVTTTVNDHYSPYEQRKGDPQPTLDVYGLAAALYFAVTGQKPEPSMDRKLYGDNLKPPRAHRPDLSDWLNQAILSGMALESEERSPSIQAWLGLLHPPQPKPQSRPTPVTPPKKEPISKTAASSSSKPFPWAALGVLLLGYMPIGLVSGLSDSPLVAGSWAVAVAVAVAVAGSWAESWAVAVILALVVAVILAVAVAGSWAWAVVLAMAVVWIVSAAWIIENVSGGWIVCFLFMGMGLGGAIAGYFTGIGIWTGLGMGLMASIQYFMIVAGVGIAEDTLQKYYRPFRIFLIYSFFSVLGLAVGGGIGWWLKLSGVNFPT